MLDVISNHSSLSYYPTFGMHKRGRVLIADDQPDFRLIYKRVLGLEGWDVLEATDGSQVLQKVMVEVPDVILIDADLPEMNGEEVIKALRALDFDIPTVLITADKNVHSLAMRLGIHWYLGKPFRPRDLKNVVEFACRSRSSMLF